MSRFPLLTAAALGALTLASTACSHADDGGRPPVLDALQGQGLEIVEEFDAGAGLRGFAGVAGQRPIAVYVTGSGEAIVGTRVDANGEEVDAGRLQELVAKPMGEKTWTQLESAQWVRDGREDAPRVIYAFSDPNCPYCNRFWQAARPWVDAGKVQIRHVLVGVIKEDSANKVAAILGDADPGAALARNERAYAQGGIPPAATVPADVRRVLDANQMLMMELGFGGTPALVFRDADDTVQRRGGMPQGGDLDVVMGPR